MNASRARNHDPRTAEQPQAEQPQPHRTPGGHDRTEVPPLLSEAEARARYRNQWLVLAVKRRGPDWRIAAGNLVARAPDRRAAHVAARRYWQDHPTDELAIFFNGEITVPPGVEVVL
jgi:hypothetical protein